MNYIRLPRPPHWHAQHWSTRAPRLPSPAATIDETIHLPPDALKWASTLMDAMCIIQTVVQFRSDIASVSSVAAYMLGHTK
jgi:hypothetical protein